MAVYKSKNPTKDGRSYYFRIKYKDIFGEIHDYSSQKYKLKKEAEQEEIRYRIRIQEQDICTSNVTFKQIYLEVRESKSKQLKKQTLLKDDNLFKHLKIIENIKINDLNLTLYKKMLFELEKEQLSADYCNKILGLFKQIIIYSNKCYNTSDSILKFVELYKNKIPKKEMLFFTYDEYKQFDSVIDNFDYHTLFSILYFLGLRQGELQALTWDDINFEKKELKVTKTLTTKIKGEKYTISSPKTKNSIRTLPIPDCVLHDLKTMLNQAMEFKDFSKNWFVFGNSCPFPETTIQKKKNDYCKLASIKQIRVHDFRHSCASLLINHGSSIALVSKYLGHSNISITLNTYTHMYKSELENISNLLNNL